MLWHIKMLIIALIKFFAISCVFFGYLWWAYQVRSEGTLYLNYAWGISTITREPGTLIAHIRGDSRASAMYGLGFS